MKNERGITLIALVFTIIVLLILAAVAIFMVMGPNGIIESNISENKITINNVTNEENEDTKEETTEETTEESTEENTEEQPAA